MASRFPLAGLLWLVAFIALAGSLHAATGPSTTKNAMGITVDGAIGPATSRYVATAIEEAAAAEAPLIILRLDTPGGLDGAMRDIVQAILASPIPIAAYVTPSGARAASAGTYILYASHIAAMAPATNLGAATPVSLAGSSPSSEPSGEQSDDKAEDDGNSKTADNATAKRRKVVNDAVAYIRGLAEQRDRNADWAERAVREGVSLTAQQALAQNVVGYVVADTPALLDAIDGTKVTTASGERVLDTADLTIEQREAGWRTEMLSIITQPTVAYLLFMIGIYGLILEGLNPGATVPGVVGAISLLCALFAFQLLPVNYAGLALMALGIGLMITEAFAPSFGMLGLGGMAAFIFGSIMLMDTDVPGFEIPLGIIGAVAIASALVLMLIVYVFLRSRRRRVHTGREGLIGSRCVAIADFEHEGRVLLHGEIWFAQSPHPVQRDQPLEVAEVEGLKVFVQPVMHDASHPSQSAGGPPARS